MNSNIQSTQWTAWYQRSFDSFEFNPADIAQATHPLFGIRKPLAYVSRSSYLPTLGLYLVTFWHNPSMSTPRLASRQEAFEYVELQTGYFVTHEQEDNLLSSYSAQTCPICARSLNLALSSGRKAVYCSDACKMRAYRQRAKCNDLTPLRNSFDVSVSQHGCVQTSLLS